MSAPTLVTVKVPATTANLGPGFDCLGAALNCHNLFQFQRLDPSEAHFTIQVTGAEAERVSTNASNLAYRAFVHYFQHLGQSSPRVALQIHLGVPLARGLGSSATAIVGGLLGANALAGSPLNQAQILDLAIALEGHPDNVAPALLGGCYLAAQGAEQGWTLCPIHWPESIVPVVAIPDFELSTHSARAVLPSQCDYEAAIFNAAHLGVLIKALESGNANWLAMALDDRLHQPYRQTLIPSYAAVRQAALEAGAYGMVISGAGPSLLALCGIEQAAQVATQMGITWKQAGVQAQVQALALDLKGAEVTLEA
ncbi:homoserine kinase [Synechococcales cyanobacterium C]|uniref:Homoserine kinase n=1 Tax=Petrachloros mirabilis ULC683 TaxID=2781853 RepID=A0A8K2ABQ9_9CYAN|nr:homoserine kinase [Petrachloros mirabilis]NCJ04995.1 homoserine kinase [Petrachloros mirabilis ULC683]